ncbi:sensor histidine kinase [Kribbella sp. NPDC056345]|uniref:sensor histidine kinase n=1 Tax=Kribbella sp. NPDC056345 TaxID=3345789 RepID=UPI0035E18946
MGRSSLRSGWLLDCLLALAILVLNLVLLGQRQQGEVTLAVSGIVLCAAAAGGMLVRRKNPLLALGLTTAAGVSYSVSQKALSPIGLFMACAAYTVMLRNDRRTRMTSVIAVVAVTLGAAAVFTHGELTANLFNGLVVLFGAAIGEAERYRRAYMRELADRAAREERLRIAHELHDVMAHHIALMNVQAGVAAHLLRRDPPGAEHALALVRDSGRTVLQELTILLGVLRRSTTPLPTVPSPSLRDLPTLVTSFEASGVAVEWTRPADLGDLPEVVELTAYRIVQESLTNVLKHAPGAQVRITIARGADALTVVVTDTGGHHHNATPSAGHGLIGHGLIGMGERVAAVNGTLRTGPTADGFEVSAVLPLLTGVTDDDPSAAGRRPDADPERLPGAGGLRTGPAGGR